MDELTESTVEQADFTREDFGLLMKGHREKAGYSIEEVSVSTRISYAYIVALESGDFEALPGVVFVKGFVKNLIKTYSLPNQGVDVINKLDLVYKEKEVEHFESPIANENKQFFMAKKKEYRAKSLFSQIQKKFFKNRKKLMYSVSAALLVTVALSVFIRTYYVEEGSNNYTDNKVQEPQKQLAAKKLPVVAQKTAVNKKTNDVKFGDSFVLLTALEKTDVRISKDYEKWNKVTLEPKEYRYDFNSNIRFVVYNAAAVKLNYNGQKIDKLGNKGQRKRISFRKKMKFDKNEKNL